ncbi:hypothetical protein [Pedobacter sp. CFBP9032]|uniref:hypothetical protein n=1 Tax=Pedobacter sp. CFBP9032 TaxID=3096539 RepID=UPI002A6A812C|nr:hypothetical protein [Pedobacter sp. CFBP9032]MDY0906589.1 hypothetical protein [Pedobacter sp. CFBP9032]
MENKTTTQKPTDFFLNAGQRISEIFEISYSYVNNKFHYKTNVEDEDITKDEIIRERIKKRKTAFIMPLLEELVKVDEGNANQELLFEYFKSNLVKALGHSIEYGETHIKVEVILDTNYIKLSLM